MHCFYIPSATETSAIIFADAGQLHHMRDVLRLGPGDWIALFDGAGNEYVAVIKNVDRKKAVLEIKERKAAAKKEIELAIGCAMPKKSLMDDIVDKLTQLNVDRIIPLVTERLVVTSSDGWEMKLERWQKIALGAARQSQRNTLPSISAPLTLSAAIADFGNYDLRLIATVSERAQPVREVLHDLLPRRVIVLIGPEGDFTPAEVEQAIAAGFQPVSLGSTVLRVETAAIAVASYLRLALT